MAHWRGIAVAACEQCGGNRVPVIHPVLPLKDWLPMPCMTTSRLAVLSLNANTRFLHDFLQGSTTSVVTCLLGPEGGFTATEETTALHHGFEPVSLGVRVLRTETAALTVAALVAYSCQTITNST
jgi:16S rRNA (uracil1498-N3)-methyltransferase